jgi:hypothetical protein
MLLRMVVGLAGQTTSLAPGDEADFPQAEALRLIEAGYAVPAVEAKIERVVKPTRKVEKR